MKTLISTLIGAAGTESARAKEQQGGESEWKVSGWAELIQLNVDMLAFTVAHKLGSESGRLDDDHMVPL